MEKSFQCYFIINNVASSIHPPNHPSMHPEGGPAIEKWRLSVLYVLFIHYGYVVPGQRFFDNDNNEIDRYIVTHLNKCD